MLFGMYDLLERSCQDNVKTGRGQDAAKAEAILEGMRERFSRLVSPQSPEALDKHACLADPLYQNVCCEKNTLTRTL